MFFLIKFVFSSNVQLTNRTRVFRERFCHDDQLGSDCAIRNFVGVKAMGENWLKYSEKFHVDESFSDPQKTFGGMNSDKKASLFTQKIQFKIFNSNFY